MPDRRDHPGPAPRPRAGGAAQDRAGLLLPSRHPARFVRTYRRSRARTSAAIAADPLLAAILHERYTDVRETLSVAASGRVDRRHQRSALPRRLGDGARGFVSAGGVRSSPLSSLRKQGPIPRELSIERYGRRLVKQFELVAMGPCVRRDDEND